MKPTSRLWIALALLLLVCYLAAVHAKKKSKPKKSSTATVKTNKNKQQICKLENATSVMKERRCRLPLTTCKARVKLQNEDGSLAYRLSFCEAKDNVLNIDKFVEQIASSNCHDGTRKCLKECEGPYYVTAVNGERRALSFCRKAGGTLKISHFGKKPKSRKRRFSQKKKKKEL